MRRYFLLSFFILLGISAFAQDISVKSFQALPKDETAKSEAGKRIDQNGQVAALIKVVTKETGFVFEGGALGIVGTQQKTGEIWVWVPRGLRKITILHQQLGGLRDYVFPENIEEGHTYEMVLTTAVIQTVVKEEEIPQQYLAFQVSPANAKLFVNEKPWELDTYGEAALLLDFGSYTYRVQAPDYHPDAGRITINNPDNTAFVMVTLQPINGKEIVDANKEKDKEKQGLKKDVRFICYAPDAELSIDDVHLGYASNTYQLSYGKHNLKATAKGFKDHSCTINVTGSLDSYSFKMEQDIVGHIAGVYSVSVYERVYFSKGNLQYRATTKTWRFADNQWDYVGNSNKKLASDYDGWIDLFGWGTSGYNNANPYDSKNRVNSCNYMGSDADIIGTNYDWGEFNAIENGGNKPGLWRTLTDAQMRYLLYKRETPSGARFAFGKVNGVKGLILLPDDWSLAYYDLKFINNKEATFDANVIKKEDWVEKMEKNGAVFLPTAGIYWIEAGKNKKMKHVGEMGFYWLGTAAGKYESVSFYFKESYLLVYGGTYRTQAHSVRLVCPAFSTQ